MTSYGSQTPASPSQPPVNPLAAAPPKATRSRPRNAAILEDLNGVSETVIKIMVRTMIQCNYHQEPRSGPTWKVVIDSANALLSPAKSDARVNVSNTINTYLAPWLAQVTMVSKRLERIKNAPFNLLSNVGSMLPLPDIDEDRLVYPGHRKNRPPNFSVRDFVVSRFIEHFCVATVDYLLNPANPLRSLPPIRDTAKNIPQVYPSHLFQSNRFSEAQVGTAGYITGYLASNAWKWAKRNYVHPFSSHIRTFIPKLVYMGQDRDWARGSGLPTVRNVATRDKGGLLYAKPEVICYVLWLDAAIDAVLHLKSYDRGSPYWADQRVRELLESDQHQEAWRRFKTAVGFDSHFDGNKQAAERFVKLFRVPIVSIKIGEFVKWLKDAGKSKEGIAAVSVLREGLKHISVK